MNETIRDYLKRRVRWCMAVGIGGWVIFASSIVTHVDNPMINILGFVMFGGSILALQWMLKCPRCSVRLGQIAMTLGIPGLKPQPNFCPYCGVSFQEPRSTQTAINPIEPYRS
jgi:hypothetical protein